MAFIEVFFGFDKIGKENVNLLLQLGRISC